MSLKSKRPRTYRRWALAVGFCVMFVVASCLPPDENVSMHIGENNSIEASEATQEALEERATATLFAASDVDLSSYSVVGYTEATATNYLNTPRGSYPVQNAFDGDTFTCWQDGVEGNGEGTELTVTLSESSNLQYIVIYNGQAISEDTFRNNGRVCQLEIRNEQFTELIEIPDENAPVAVRLVEGWENVSQVTFKINSVYPGSVYADTCISEIVFYK